MLTAAPPIARIPPAALLDLHRLATLREVARCGSYAAAAKSRCFTPSAVSQQMAGLARDLGFPLFDRTPRGMRLTAAGDVLVAHIDAVFGRLNEAQGELEAVLGGVQGRLRVGSFPAATVGFVAQAMRALEDRFPRVDLFLSDGEPYESVVRLKERELDLAIVFDADHRALAADADGHLVCRDTEIACVRLFDDPCVVVVPSDHPLAVLEDVEVAQLAGERILGGPCGSSTWGNDLAELLRQGGVDARFDARYRTADVGALQALVATGRGITLVPELAPRWSHPGVVTRRLVGGPVRRVSVAALAEIPLSTAGAALVDLLQRSVAVHEPAPPVLAAVA